LWIREAGILLLGFSQGYDAKSGLFKRFQPVFAQDGSWWRRDSERIEQDARQQTVPNSDKIPRSN
jgi:hypothetical protein